MACKYKLEGYGNKGYWSKIKEVGNFSNKRKAKNFARGIASGNSRLSKHYNKVRLKKVGGKRVLGEWTVKNNRSNNLINKLIG